MPTHILRIDSSIFSDQGESSRLTARLVAQIQRRLEKDGAGSRITHRDFGKEAIPHFSADTIADIGASKATLGDTLIDEIQTADIVVLGVPMYNFGVPTTLKAWFDHIARAGVTFEYTEQGPRGLLENKKVYVVNTRGGLHRGESSDVETPYLKIMLEFLGLTEVTFIYAEGLNMGDQRKAIGLAAANEHIDAIAEAV